MEQGLIDIRNKAKELANKSRLGVFRTYPISCGTLIAILDELEAAEQRRVPVSAEQKCPRCNGEKSVGRGDTLRICHLCKGTGSQKGSHYEM